MIFLCCGFIDDDTAIYTDHCVALLLSLFRLQILSVLHHLFSCQLGVKFQRHNCCTYQLDVKFVNYNYLAGVKFTPYS